MWRQGARCGSRECGKEQERVGRGGGIGGREVGTGREVTAGTESGVAAGQRGWGRVMVMALRVRGQMAVGVDSEQQVSGADNEATRGREGKSDGAEGEPKGKHDSLREREREQHRWKEQ